ncbi:MAG: LamG-like jellyroll fold domain-containing protein [Phycisphaerales bacterium]
MKQVLCFAILFFLLSNYVIAADPDLVGWWKFDETTGTNAADSSCYGYDGTVTGATWITGIIGGALDFEGTDYVDVNAAVFSDNIEEQVTIAFWQYGDNVQPQADFSFYVADNSNTRIAAAHVPWPGEDYGVVYWQAGNPTDSYDEISKYCESSNEIKNEWNYWAFTKNTTTGNMKIYLNGKLWHVGYNKTKVLAGATKFTIGCYTDHSSYAYDGMIDDFRVYNRELEAQEIEELYNRKDTEIKGVVTATASSNYPGYIPNLAVDGTGMNVGAGMSDRYHDSDPSHMWLSTYNGGEGYTTTPWFKFEFDKTYKIDEMWVWNYNSQTSRGMRNVTIEYSTNGTSWSTLTSNYEIPQASGSETQPPSAKVGFNGTSAKFVKITANVTNGNWGDNTYFGLGEVRFFVKSQYATLPSPADGTKRVAPNLTLSWTNGSSATTHRVFFGDSFTAVKNATTGSDEYKGSSYSPSNLTLNDTYYWRVDELDASGTYVGPVWCFTVRDYNVAGGITSPLYVSTATGNDNNNGSEQNPFKTIERAKIAAKEIIDSGLSADLNIYIKSGTYYLDEPLVFDSEDGGNSTYKVIYQNYPGETPVISGGTPITGWSSIGGGKYTATVSGIASHDWWFRQLWINDERCTRSRWPNAGDINSLLVTQNVSGDMRTITFNSAIGTNPAVRRSELVCYDSWTIGRAMIISISGNSVTTETVAGALGNPLTFPTPDSNGVDPNWGINYPANRGHLEHNTDYIDTNTEWHLSESTGVLTMQYTTDPDNAIVIAPRLEKLIIIEGSSGNPVKNITFKGLAFKHTMWNLPYTGYSEHQAARFGPDLGKRPFYVIPSAVELKYAEDISFERCLISNIAQSGIALGAGCDDNYVIDCEFYDIGGCGIMNGWQGNTQNAEIFGGETLADEDWPTLSDAPERNTFNNNYLHKIANEWYGAVGIADAYTKYTDITNNKLTDLPYTGISTGFNGISSACSQDDVLVEENHITAIMKILNDGAGIYTLGNHSGGLINGNLIHTIDRGWWKDVTGSAAVYTDGHTTNITIQNNVSYDVNGPDYVSNSSEPNIVLTNNHWDEPPGGWGTTEQAIADAAGTSIAAPTVSLTNSGDNIAVTGECEAWARTYTARITESNTSVTAYLVVSTTGAISGSIPKSLLGTSTATLEVVTYDPDSDLSSAGTSNTLDIEYSPKAWWKFNETSGSSATDSSGNGYTGSVSGASWDGSGKFNGCLNFNGTDSVTINNGLFTSHINSQVTISFWQYGDTALQPQADICFYASDSSYNRVANIHLPWSDEVVYWDAGNPTDSYDRITKTCTSSTQYEGQWNHWAFVKNADTGSMKIYLNGSLWHTSTGCTKTMSGCNIIKIGSYGDGSSYCYDGKLDDFRIYNRELSSNTIQKIYLGSL